MKRLFSLLFCGLSSVILSFGQSKSDTNLTVKEFVNTAESGFCTLKGTYKETYDVNDIVFLLEGEQYVIPVRLQRKDLGAGDRFQSLALHRGDSLVVRGSVNRVRIDNYWYKGLVDAVIYDIKRNGVREDNEEVRESTFDKHPFQLVEQKPSFRGGDANEFSKWVNNQLKYPKLAKENGVQGKVMVSFTIKTDGSVTDVRVLHGVEHSLDEEAVRVISNSPRWSPGRTHGEPVDVTLTFPVYFILH